MPGGVHTPMAIGRSPMRRAAPSAILYVLGPWGCRTPTQGGTAKLPRKLPAYQWRVAVRGATGSRKSQMKTAPVKKPPTCAQ